MTMDESGDPPAAPGDPPQNEVSAQAVAWFVRMRADEVAPADRAAFERWCAVDPAHRRAYDEVARLWQSPAWETARPRQRDAAGGPKLAGRALAACLVLGISMLVAQRYAWFSAPPDFVTAPGAQSTVQLSDGSRLLLDSDSAVRVHFAAKRREVQVLRGRVYADVRHDTGRPFVLYDARARARALGTRYAFEHGTDTRVHVRRGSVAVTNGGISRVTLRAGEVVTVDANGDFGQVVALANEFEFAWVDGRFAFDDAPLGTVVQALERYLPGRVFVVGQALSTVHLSGNYRLDDPRAVLRSLATIAGADLVELGPYVSVLR